MVEGKSLGWEGDDDIFCVLDWIIGVQCTFLTFRNIIFFFFFLYL